MIVPSDTPKVSMLISFILSLPFIILDRVCLYYMGLTDSDTTNIGVTPIFRKLGWGQLPPSTFQQFSDNMNIVTNTTRPIVERIENILINVRHRLYLRFHLSCSCFISSIDKLSYFIHQIGPLTTRHFTFGTFAFCDTIRTSILKDVRCNFHTLT